MKLGLAKSASSHRARMGRPERINLAGGDNQRGLSEVALTTGDRAMSFGTGGADAVGRWYVVRAAAGAVDGLRLQVAS